ncbi:MAG: ComEC/Rec2 family competence protein [Pirellulaceae bacterium]
MTSERVPIAPQSARPQQPLVGLLAAMGAGIVWDRYLAVPLWIWLSLTLTGVLVWFVSKRRPGTRWPTWCLILALAAVAGAWHHYCWRLFSHRDLGLRATEVPRPVCVEAIAKSTPRRLPAPPIDLMTAIPRGDRSRLAVTLTSVREHREWQPATGRATVTVDGHLLDVRRGDRLRIWAALSSSPKPRNPGEFDYADAERAQRRLCRLHVRHPDCVVRVRRATFGGVGSWLMAVRDAGAALLWRHVSHPRAGLAAAILLGAREQVDRSITEDFFRTGTVHLLAISGLHVGILAYGFWWSVRCMRISRRGSLLAAMVLVNLYAQLTDSRPPVVRASILITCLCLARLSGRQNQPFNTLAFAGMLVLAWNPSHLFQTGPQLSFLAVAALICSRHWLGRPFLPVDPLDRLIVQTRSWPRRAVRRGWHAVWRLSAASGIIWVASLPLVMYRFHLVSPVALLVNPVVSLPMATSLFSGFGVLLSGWMLPPLAAVCGVACDASLYLIEWCVQVSLSVKGGYFWTPPPPLWWVLGFYAGAGSLVAMRRFRPSLRRCALLTTAWLVLGIGLSRVQRCWHEVCNRDRLTCTFASVGHGTSVLLELPQGKTLLYDAGRRGSSTSVAQSIAGLLWSRGIVHLDGIILSHADSDHYNALPELLERFSAGAIYVSPLMFQEDSAPLRALRESVADAGLSFRELVAGDRLWADGDAVLTVLHPSRSGAPGSDNANSIVLRVDYRGRILLLPGDLELSGLHTLLAQRPVDCDVAMAPHHGSARSNPSGFAAWARPDWVVISGDVTHDAPRVRDAFHNAGARTLHTGKRGAVQFVFDAEGVHVRSWRDDPW